MNTLRSAPRRTRTFDPLIKSRESTLAKHHSSKDLDKLPSSRCAPGCAIFEIDHDLASFIALWTTLNHEQKQALLTLVQPQNVLEDRVPPRLSLQHRQLQTPLQPSSAVAHPQDPASSCPTITLLGTTPAIPAPSSTTPLSPETQSFATPSTQSGNTPPLPADPSSQEDSTSPPPVRHTGPFSKPEWQSLTDRLSLPERQAEILGLLLEGDNDKQIARKLGISLPTLRTHLQRTYARFKVSNRTSLIVELFRLARAFSI